MFQLLLMHSLNIIFYQILVKLSYVCSEKIVYE